MPKSRSPGGWRSSFHHHMSTGACPSRDHDTILPLVDPSVDPFSPSETRGELKARIPGLLPESQKGDPMFFSRKAGWRCAPRCGPLRLLGMFWLAAALATVSLAQDPLIPKNGCGITWKTLAQA